MLAFQADHNCCTSSTNYEAIPRIGDTTLTWEIKLSLLIIAIIYTTQAAVKLKLEKNRAMGRMGGITIKLTKFVFNKIIR